MIKRIVRLSIEEDKTDEFVNNFNNNKVAIKNFEGCEHLELWQDEDQKNVFVTFSHWKSTENLEAYRNSELFRGIWTKTKSFFCAKPMAWSHVRIS